MNELDLLAPDERELFFQTAADIQNMPFEIIEKRLLGCMDFRKVVFFRKSETPSYF